MPIRFTLLCFDVNEQDPAVERVIRLIKENSPSNVVCEGVVIAGEKKIPESVQTSLAGIADLYSVGGANVHESVSPYCLLADIDMALAMFDHTDAMISLGTFGQIPDDLSKRLVYPDSILTGGNVVEKIADVVEATNYRGKILCICNQLLHDETLNYHVELVKSYNATHDVFVALLSDCNDVSAVEKLQDHATLIVVPHDSGRSDFITELLKQVETVFNWGHQPNWYINGRPAVGRYEEHKLCIAYAGVPAQIEHFDASLRSLRETGYHDDVYLLADCTCVQKGWSQTGVIHDLMEVNAEHNLWRYTAQHALKKFPDADFFLIVRPDTYFGHGFLEAIQFALTDNELKSAFNVLSLYTPAHDTFYLPQDQPGWNLFRGWDPWGDIALTFSRETLEKLCQELEQGSVNGEGYSIYQGLRITLETAPAWYTHQPSLVDRIGVDAVLDPLTRQRPAFSPVAWDPRGRGLNYYTDKPAVPQKAAPQTKPTTESVRLCDWDPAVANLLPMIPVIPAVGTLVAHPKVSIVLPVFNGANYISQAIGSVLAQTYTNWELIIVDDGSTDDTLQVVRRFLDPRICIVQSIVNKKLPAALNLGFRMAQGELLTWISHDNICRPEMLTTLVAALEDQDVDIVYGNGIVTDRNGENYELEISHEPPMLEIRSCISLGFMYRRRVAELVGEYREEFFLAEDYDFFLRAYRKNVKFKHILDVLFFNRWHEKQLGTVRKDESFDVAVRVRQANKVNE